jgi:hypothetical protein
MRPIACPLLPPGIRTSVPPSPRDQDLRSVPSLQNQVLRSSPFPPISFYGCSPFSPDSAPFSLPGSDPMICPHPPGSYQMPPILNPRSDPTVSDPTVCPSPPRAYLLPASFISRDRSYSVPSYCPRNVIVYSPEDCITERRLTKHRLNER